MIYLSAQRSLSRRVLLLTVSLTFVFYVAGCVKRAPYQPSITRESNPSITDNQSPAAKRLNLNTASTDELEKLPGIGKALAIRIVEYREKYGPFRKPEHLIIVRGISDHRFRALRDLITVE
jgi:competence ComEA-like helix-hairpin-helix protein